MKQIKNIILFLSCLAGGCEATLAQTPVSPVGPVTTNTVYYEPSTHRFPVYRGATYGWVWPLNRADSAYYITPYYFTHNSIPLGAALLRANNLSDVSNASTSLSNLNGVSLLGSYSNPAWLTGLVWSKITGTPTTLSGYGITDGITATYFNANTGTSTQTQIDSKLAVTTAASTYLKLDGSNENTDLNIGVNGYYGGSLNIGGSYSGNYAGSFYNTAAGTGNGVTIKADASALTIYNTSSVLKTTLFGNGDANFGGIITGIGSGLSAIPNSALNNSTISGIALGNNLASLTATNSTLTFSGSYYGAAAQTIGLNLNNANTWTNYITTTYPIHINSVFTNALTLQTSGVDKTAFGQSTSTDNWINGSSSGDGVIYTQSKLMISANAGASASLTITGVNSVFSGTLTTPNQIAAPGINNGVGDVTIGANGGGTVQVPTNLNLTGSITVGARVNAGYLSMGGYGIDVSNATNPISDNGFIPYSTTPSGIYGYDLSAGIAYQRKLTAATLGTFLGLSTTYQPLENQRLSTTNSPTFANVTATAFSGAGTGLTGTAASLSIGGNAATVTTNANLTGDITSVGNTTSYNNTVPTAKLGTGTASSTTALFGDQTYKTVVQSFSGTGIAGFFSTGISSAPNASIGFTLNNQVAGQVFASPATITGAPSFRSLVPTDVPTLNQNTTGSASSLTTSRNIQGVAFNGTADINPINGTGFVKVTGTTLTYDNSTYQPLLVSGTNIKTINSASLLGSGNIALQTPLTAGTDYLTPTGVGSGLTALTAANISAGIAGINISGNAATVSNGVYTTGSYSDPTWLTSLAYSKLTGAPTNVSTFTNDAGYLTGSYTGFDTRYLGLHGLADNSTAWSSNLYAGALGSNVPEFLMTFSATDGNWHYASNTQIQSFLGLGSNAFTSTAYLPLTGGTLSGNLGIGVSPVVALDVNGSINLTTGYNLTWGGVYGAGIPAISGGANGILFYPAGSTSGERMRISSSGFVGIGYTADPTSGNLFAVNGNSYFNGTGTFTGTLSASNLSGTNTGDETTARINALYGYTPANGANYLALTGGTLTGDLHSGYNAYFGNLIVANGNAISFNGVYGGANPAITGSTTSGLQFSTNSTSALTLDNSQNAYFGNTIVFSNSGFLDHINPPTLTSSVATYLPANGGLLATTIHGNSTTTGAATTAVTVTIGSTLANTNYFVDISPQDVLTAVNYYISAKTTTTFTVTFISALTGTINFDYNITP